MMWNKLLLTEFVIYLCCLVGLMLLVFEFYRPFFSFSFFFWKLPPTFFCIVCWCAHNLAVLEIDDQISIYFCESCGKKNNLKMPFRVGSVISLQVSRRYKNNPHSVLADLFILRDTVGLGSQTSRAATVPSLPCADESWLPGLPSPSFYFNHLCSEVGDNVGGK